MPEFLPEEHDDQVFRSTQEPSALYGNCPTNVGIQGPGRFTLGAKKDDDGCEDPVDENKLIGPVEINEHDDTEPKIYNPFRYAYPIIIDELNLEVMIKFIIDDLDHENKNPLTFTNTEGKEYTFAFFPTVQEHAVPIEDTYEGIGDLYNFYRDGERRLVIIPTVVRAKIYGNGLDGDEATADALITKEYLEEILTPERLAQAFEDFKNDLECDPAAPAALYCLMQEACGDSAWRGQGDEDDYDEDDDEDW